MSDKVLNAIIKPALETKRRNIDYGIYIIGDRGSGKSTLAMWLMEQIEKRLDFPKNRILKLLIFDKSSFLNAVNLLIKLVGSLKVKEYYLMLLFDEVTKIAQKRRFATKLNQAVWELVTLMRPLNATYFFVTPDIDDIDKELRTPDVIHTLFWVYIRGHAFVWSRYGLESAKQKTSSVQYILTNYEKFKEHQYYFDLPQVLAEAFPPRARIKFDKPSKEFIVDNSHLLKPEIEKYDEKHLVKILESKESVDYNSYLEEKRFEPILETLYEIKEILKEENNGLTQVEKEIYSFLDSLPVGNYVLVGSEKPILYFQDKVIYDPNVNIAVWLHVLKIMNKENKLRFVKTYDKKSGYIVYIAKVSSNSDQEISELVNTSRWAGGFADLDEGT